MKNPLKFSGEVVLVTGGAEGIGCAIVHTFLAAGAEVITCGPVQPKNLPAADGRSALFTPVNGCEQQQIEGCMDFASERFGRLDVLVNVAINMHTAFDALADPAESLIRAGLIAPLHFSQAANRLMQKQASGGSIINITCPGEEEASQRPAAVDAASAGLANLGTSLAVEWGPRVRVNTIVMDLTQSEQSTSPTDNAPGSADDSTSPGIHLPLGIGNACLFLASPLASYVSGARLAASQ
jgi:NAD(P)-dependent dehydrogenase (short-subunit alcohol dehydrogenase family)